MIHLFSSYSNPSTVFITFLLLVLNSLLNPLLYVTIKVTIRKAYCEAAKWILYWLCGCKAKYKPNGIGELLVRAHVSEWHVPVHLFRGHVYGCM